MHQKCLVSSFGLNELKDLSIVLIHIERAVHDVRFRPQWVEYRPVHRVVIRCVTLGYNRGHVMRFYDVAAAQIIVIVLIWVVV